jgi:tetratricopeptide (TPR) repeat protein
MRAVPGKAFILTIILFVCGTLGADDDALDYYFPDLIFKDDLTVQQYERVQIMLQIRQVEQAREAAEILIDDNLDLAESNPILFGKLLANLGTILAYQEKYPEAMQALDVSLQTVEAASNPYTLTLKKIIMARGLVQTRLRLFEEAEGSFRRAQHIAHRIGGVYTPDQLEVLRHLTRLNLKQGNLIDADREQVFSLRVTEQAYGENSEELLPILQRLGAYFASRGGMFSVSGGPDFRYFRDQMFRQSIKYYERAINIVEDNYGINDLRLIEPLRGLARARLLQVTNRSASEAALERVVHIVDSNPVSDVADRVKAMISLGDMYTITGDKRASGVYLSAWTLMQEDDAYRQLAAEVFGTPTRLHPNIDGIMYLDRIPDAAAGEDTELFIDVAYSVLPNGRVSNIELIEKNVPNAQVRYMRSLLADARFRPRILNGELVATENLMIHQRFQVIQRAPPTNRISIGSTSGNKPTIINQ